jgi:multicomponent Na+:H+ antiporter subunit A
MLLAILIPIVIALVFFLPFGAYKEKISRAVVLLPFSLFLYFAFAGYEKIEQLASQGPAQALLPFALQFHFDGLSKLFALLITGIGTLIFWYAGAYMKGEKYSLRLFGFLSLFMGAMLGLVLSDNILSLFLFWELTSISSFFLIGFKSEDPASRQSALRALAITGGGGLVLFGGLLVLGEMSQTYSLQSMLMMRDGLVDQALYPLAFVLIFIGAATKSAQFPFHFWLPGAMKAPTPVSAYLHSATMVKAGVYLLARLNPIMGGTELWQNTLLIVGAVTMVYTAFHAITKTDLKAILAYSTVSALGIMFFLLGLGTEKALFALGLFVLIHGLYKASLFMVAGIVDHETGTRDLRALGGLRKVLLPVAIAGFLAALSSGGIPLTLGFIGKDLIYEATTHSGSLAFPLTTIALVANLFIFASGFMAGWRPFSGSLAEDHKDLHLPEFSMWAPPLILSVMGLLLGLNPGILDAFVNEVFFSIGGQSQGTHLAIWHGFNLVLGLSALTLLAGALVYFLVTPGGKLTAMTQFLLPISPQTLLEKTANSFLLLANKITQLLQNGFLRIYVLVILLFTSALLIYKMTLDMTFVLDWEGLSPVTIYEGITVVILWIAIFFTVFSSSRLVAVASLGVIGLAICLIFVYYSAPDLAMTQFTIDTLTVILFVLVLYRLPRFLPYKFQFRHIRDAFVALTFGSIMGLLAIEVLQQAPDKTISDFYAENAYVLAKGKNIVNVILVDFRGADTMVEIVVLSIAAIGVFGLLKLQIRKSQMEE